jgi:hypothetical protein
MQIKLRMISTNAFIWFTTIPADTIIFILTFILHHAQKLKINKKPTKKQTISIEHMSSTNEPNTSSQWKDIVIISNNGTCTYFWFLNIKLREVLLNSKYTWLNRLCSSQVQFISSYLLHNSFVIIITD